MFSILASSALLQYFYEFAYQWLQYWGYDLSTAGDWDSIPPVRIQSLSINSGYIAQVHQTYGLGDTWNKCLKFCPATLMTRSGVLDLDLDAKCDTNDHDVIYTD